MIVGLALAASGAGRAAGAEPAPRAEPPSIDGAPWIVEVSDQRYHVVDRWSGGSIDKLGLAFLALSGLEIPEGEIYERG